MCLALGLLLGAPGLLLAAPGLLLAALRLLLDFSWYKGQKAEVFDRRVKSVRRLAQRMFAACRLPCRVVSGVKELLPLKAHVVDGIGHYQGTPHAYDSFTRALAEFCMLAPGYSGPRRSRL